MTITTGVVASIASQGTPAGTTVEEWIAKARQESGVGDGLVDEKADNGTAAGVWQVNYRVHKQYARDWLLNPLNCWTATKAIYASQGWQAWAASGGKPTPTAKDREAAQNPAPVHGWGVGAISDAVDDLVPEPLAELAGYVRDAVEVVIAAGEWIADPHNIARVALVLAGAAVAVAAVNIVARPVVDQVAGPAGDIARTVATKGAA